VHDLRHEATSRFFEKGLNVMEVASVTGHKTLQMLKRYTHLSVTLRFRGLRVMIYSFDHRPPHVHVIGPGAEARIALGDEGERPGS
jgi:hypothetical protein